MYYTLVKTRGDCTTDRKQIRLCVPTMNLGDPELELIDPTPNIHLLFVHFDKLFFNEKLASRAVVRWSKRMYSCAGICSYEGRGGLCDIALSEPLLKLRLRKDLVETLLHEMIHAYLFVTSRDRDRDGHGPNFQAHMHRINKFAGLNISIYHSFHDEVKLYQTHWWRCNGPCQTWRPYFGIVRRSCNRAPGPNDIWWEQHQRKCGGTFIKIKEPEKASKKKAPAKSKGDITKYINTSKTVIDKGSKKNQNPSATVLKTVNINVPRKSEINTPINLNGSNKAVFTKNGTTSSPKPTKPPLLKKGEQMISSSRNQSNSVNVAETVRNVWANKQLINVSSNGKHTLGNKETLKNNAVVNPNKQKAKTNHEDLPPTKLKKIDDVFRNMATTVLKDVYGHDYKITQPSNSNKLIAVANNSSLVNCPICNVKVSGDEVNKHLDECLNKEVIEQLSKENETNQVSSNNIVKSSTEINPLKDIADTQFNVPVCKSNAEIPSTSKNMNSIKTTSVDLTHFNKVKFKSPQVNSPIVIEDLQSRDTNPKIKNRHSVSFDPVDVQKVKTIVKKINFEKQIRKSDNFIVPKKEEPKEVDFGYLPPFLDDIARDIKLPPVKIEPGTSKDIAISLTDKKCPCCGAVVDKRIEDHLDECLAFFVNNDMIPDEGASTSFANETIIIDDDDDIFDETFTMNATGTKCPCPCCLEMVEGEDMRSHLDRCLS